MASGRGSGAPFLVPYVAGNVYVTMCNRKKIGINTHQNLTYSHLRDGVHLSLNGEELFFQNIKSTISKLNDWKNKVLLNNVLLGTGKKSAVSRQVSSLFTPSRSRSSTYSTSRQRIGRSSSATETSFTPTFFAFNRTDVTTTAYGQEKSRWSTYSLQLLKKKKKKKKKKKYHFCLMIQRRLYILFMIFLYHFQIYTECVCAGSVKSSTLGTNHQ